MKYTYHFNSNTISYNNALEFGYKCAKENVLYEMDGNPYDPNNTDYYLFNQGVKEYREDQKKITQK